jgi:4-hydroxy-tetrahydrodipicolinate synthase
MFQGSMVALVTPMREDGSIDFPALRKLIDFHIDNGTTAIIAVGTTGESATVNVDEHCQIIKESVKHIRGRVPVIAGTGANSTAEAIELTRYAREARADACLLVTPYYNKPPQEGLYRHYKAIAEAVPIPQILYNVPGRTACDMLPETVIRLAAIPNIIGIKEATGKIDRVKQITEACGDRMEVYSGDDATALDLMLAGGQGVISVTANVAPKQMSELCSAALVGDEATARAINERLMDLHKKLFVEANPIPVKWALKEMGLIEGGIRLPLTPLAEEYHAVVRQALRTAGVLG